MQVTIKQLMQASPLLAKETLNRINQYVAVKAGNSAFPLQPFEIYGIKCKLLFLKVPTGVKIGLHIAEKFKVETEIASDSFGKFSVHVKHVIGDVPEQELIKLSREMKQTALTTLN